MSKKVVIKERSQLEIDVAPSGYVVITERTAVGDVFSVSFPFEDIKAVAKALRDIHAAGKPDGAE